MNIFIGSSKEQAKPGGLLDEIARIVQRCGCKPVRWNDPAIFRPGRSTLENLEEMIGEQEIGASIFICTVDDKTWYRGNIIGTPRDNVIFEYGLFLGKLGRLKSEIVKSGNVTLPTDVDGIYFFDFSPDEYMKGECDIKAWLNGLK
jgi:predicted nucleotide-binding protein